VNSDQSTTPAPATTDNSATATAGQTTDKNADQSKLPQTASPLPLLGLMGFSSLLGGFFARRKK